MKNRDLYLSSLLDFKDREQVKVITGVRRSGKSTLLTLFKQHLQKTGVPCGNIIHLNFESLLHKDLMDGESLWKYVIDRASNAGRAYVLLDEVQLVTGWERCVNALRIDCDSDIYITGSNASLLATHRSSILGGRCVNIKMLPLSFWEYLDFNPIDEITDGAMRDFLHLRKFEEYLKFGGMPAIAGQDISSEAANANLLDVFDAVLARDVIEQNNVRDPALLRAVAMFLAFNVGSTVSPKKISDYLTSSGRKTANETIDNYLKMLTDSFLFYKAQRYDLKGKLFLKTLGKFYIVDTGIRNALIGYREADFGHVLENIVFFELMRTNNAVSIGKQNGYEVDFVADSFDNRKYYQVAASVLDENTFKRELRPLESIKDNYEKTILTMDRNFTAPINGIRVVNIVDFLLGGT